MNIIQVTHEKQVPKIHFGYVNTTPENAAMAHKERFGKQPEVVYVKNVERQRGFLLVTYSTVYIEVSEDEYNRLFAARTGLASD